ncbi:MAG: phosphotransferase family protein [Acidimicrobiales bacterium]
MARDVRSQGRGWATELGDTVAKLHRLSPPAPVASRNLIPKLRSSAPERLARFGLPSGLVEQVPQYLAGADQPAVLVHADVTAGHVFMAEGELEGIIDWGEAIVADRHYDFVAVYLDAFSGSAELFEAFLEGYGLDRDEAFTTRALQGVLEFQFDAISRIGELVSPSSIRTLDELAERLFAL